MGIGKKLYDNKLVQAFFQKKLGDHAVEIIKLYSAGHNVADDKVAKKMNLKVTVVRTYLNKLHYWGIADYTKTRNKKTGWYSYDWFINHKRTIELLLLEQEDQLKKLQQEETTMADYTLFACKKKCDSLAFEIAVQYEFKCPSCGSKMDCVNSEHKSKVIRKEIQEIEITKNQLFQLQKQLK